MALALAALCGAAFATCVSQPTTYAETCGVNSFSDCGDTGTYLAIAFMFVSLAIALAYMYGKLKEDHAAETWAKDEAFNLIITIFLFIGLLLFFNASCTVVQGYFPLKNPFTAAEGYIDRLLLSNGLGILQSMTYDSINNQLEATSFFYTSISPFSGSGSAFKANLKSLSAHKEFLIDLYLPILASLNGQKYLLQMLQWMGAAVLLPFAFVLRLVPFTRDFGNTMIALFFSIYIVVPFLYAASGEAYEKIISQPRCEYVDSGGNCYVHNFYSYGLDNGDATAGGAASGKTMQKSVLYRMGSTIPQAVFIPNLVAIVAITCTMALSKALRAIAV